MLVHPLEMCKTPPMPGNDVFEPGDVEFYLLGHLEGRRSEDYRASVRTDFARQERYIALQRPVHHRPAGHYIRLLQVRRLSVPESMPDESLSGDQWQQFASGVSTRGRSTSRRSIEDGFHVPSKAT